MIVNADDFGLDGSVNRGIVRAFERGLISSATIMANQPGFEEAVELVHELRLDPHVGIHLVLTRGVPLTEVMRRSRRFCDTEGSFTDWRAIGRAWRFRGEDREALVQELRAQVQRVRAAGLAITHADSHHHVHNDWGVGRCVIAVATEAGIPFVRLARNCGPGISLASSLYKRTFNARLRRHGLARTRWFGEPRDWLHLEARGVERHSLESFEAMTHPTLDEESRLVDALDPGRELHDLLAPMLRASAPVSYSGDRYAAA